MNKHLIVLTGYSERDLKKKKFNKNLRRCYRCKRTEADKTAVIFDNEVMFQDMQEFHPLTVLIEDKDNPVLFKYWLCAECYLLKEHEHSISEKKYPMELFERNDI